MYTKEQVDEMLSEVENEINIAFETMNKNEEEVATEEIATEEIEATADESLEKSEDEVEAQNEVEEDYETIDDLYGSMTKSEQEAHYAAVKKSLFGMEKSDDDDDLSPHAKEQKAKAAQTKLAQENKASGKVNPGYDEGAHRDDDVAAKVYRDKLKRQQGQRDDTKKSEDMTEMEAMLKSENEELKKNYEELNALVEKLFNKDKEAPKGKALTGYDVITKGEDVESEENKITSMSKGEVKQKLNQIDYSTLSKSDRDAINEYCLENGSVEKIKHLIKE
jgi:hypothetical protein